MKKISEMWANHKEKQMKPWSKKRKIAFAAIFVLLLIYFFVSSLVKKQSIETTIPNFSFNLNVVDLVILGVLLAIFGIFKLIKRIKENKEDRK